MPWNNQGGGWQGGQGPWGGRPGGGGPRPPDLEELLRKSQEKVKSLFPGGGGLGRPGRAVGLVVLVLAALWLASGFYRVLPEEQGVVLRFGKLNRETGPGLHYHLPAPIESVLTPQVTRVSRIEIGFRSGGAPTGRTSGNRDVTDESLMLTGDENIIDVNFVVLWKIQDAADFLFNIREPEDTVKATAESVVREIIGQTPIVQATTEGRRLIETRAREQLQTLMNNYGAGIAIDEVQLQKADPPPEVIDAFRDVQRAQADRERAQNEAEAYSNDIIPRARGEAERILQDAQAYKQESIARATGEGQRFDAVLAAYRKAKDVTTTRMYIETMQDVLSGASKVVIDTDAKGPGVVPYLPLPSLQQAPPLPAPTAAGPPAASSGSAQ